MKYFTKTINDKDYNFRLTSEDICNIENKAGKTIQEAIIDVSFNHVSTLMKYMRKGDISEFRTPHDFIDFLIDEGYSLESIYTEIIFPTCVLSGILTERDLNTIKEAITKQHSKEAKK